MEPTLKPDRALVLQSLADEIEAVAHSRAHLRALADRYAREHKLKLTFTTGTNVARMLGVSATNTESPEAALANWAHAARRKLLGLGDA